MIKVISRESPLAKCQVEEFFREFPAVDYSVSYTKSLGDRELDKSLLTDTIPMDFFTRELDRAVLDGDADIAIHSAKDLPWPLARGLRVISLLHAFDQSDSLVTLNGVSLADLPWGARVGTSSPSRKEQLLAVRPDLTIISIRGAIGQRIDYLYRNECEAIIVASCALTRLAIDLPAEQLPFETHPLQGNLAVVARLERQDLSELFKNKDVRRSWGTVTLVGAGPGDPELLTVKAVKAIESADSIYYDALCGDRVLGDTKANLFFVGKRKGEHSLSQKEINHLLFDAARRGERVVRLKAGDPLLFSRGGEEIEFLAQRMIDVAVIPGISSFQAAAAAVTMPITMRELSRTFCAYSGQYEVDQPIPATNEGTSAYFMAVTKLAELQKSLIEVGRSLTTPVILVHNCSQPDQQVARTSLGQLHLVVIPTPALILVGETAGLATEKPRLLFTGIDSSRLRFSEELVHFPLVATQIRQSISIDLESYDGIVFTSRSAVTYFFRLFRPKAGQTIFAVGPHTAEALQEFGIGVDYMPTVYDAEHLFPLIDQSSCRKVLYPCSQLSKNPIHQLTTIDPVVFYDTVSPSRESIPPLSSFVGVIFSSPSTVDAFFALWELVPQNMVFYVYGKSSRFRLLSYGVDSQFICDVQL